MWADSGFALGNHTFSHIDFNASSVQGFEDEIVANQSVLQGLMGAREQLTEEKHLKYPPHAERPMDKLDAICR